MAEQGQPLSSWKEISSYLGRTVRTCQRLEAAGLPVHRLDGSPKAHVFAYPRELDDWLARKVNERGQAGKRRHRLLFMSAATAAVAAAAAFFLIVLRPGPDARSIAILARDLSPRRGFEYVPDQIAESIRSGLMRVEGIKVAGERSSEAVGRDRKLSERDIGRILKVANLLVVSVTVDGDDLRVIANLVSTKDGYQKWGRIYEEPFEDISGVQDRIMASIVEQLKVVLRPGDKSGPRRPLPENFIAYEFYMKGRDLLGRPWPGAPQQALGFFEQALAQAPHFALAYAGIARAYVNMVDQILVPAAEGFPKAGLAVKSALDLDPDLADAHALNAWLRFQYDYDGGAAEKSFRRALELKPGDALTRGTYAAFLLSRGKLKEARAEINVAIAADPLMPLLHAYAMWIHLSSGQSQEVLQEFSRVQQIEQDLEFAYFFAGLAYLDLGHLEKAEKMFERGMRLPRTPARCDAGLLVCHLKKGEREKAEALYERMLKDREKKFVSPAMLAWGAAALGDGDGAFEWFDEAYRARDPQLLFAQVYARAFAPDISRDPRFLAVTDKLGLPPRPAK